MAAADHAAILSESAHLARALTADRSVRDAHGPPPSALLALVLSIRCQAAPVGEKAACLDG